MCPMFTATASNSHNILQHLPTFQCTRLSHAKHCLSICVGIRIIICISNPHSGLNTVPTGLH